ncbi:MAG: esterase family protein [Oscillospiraceae bacterium]|nr:esterase family protein [Oscillospiraceae bacterium]
MSLLHIDLFSKVLQMDTGISVIVPESMQGIGLEGAHAEDNYPVLWLLHGRSDDHTIWMRRTSIERYAAPLGIMVVMPEVSYSRYMNMVYGPRYRDFIADELYHFCKKLFPHMSTDRKDHYIAGLSMGGGGAMLLGLTYPEQYGTICMLSTGGVAPLEGLWRAKGGQDTNYRRLNTDIYGTDDTDSLAGTEYDILKLIRDTARNHALLPEVYHAMGTEDVRYPVAMKIKETFESIPGNPYHYEYHEGHGKHEWIFWDEWIRKFLDSRFCQEEK